MRRGRIFGSLTLFGNGTACREMPADGQRVIFVERARVGLFFVYAQLG